MKDGLFYPTFWRLLRTVEMAFSTSLKRYLILGSLRILNFTRNNT